MSSTEATTMTSDTPDEEELPPRPYSFWQHPAKSWIDFFVSYLVSFLYPIHKLANLPAHEPHDLIVEARSGKFATKGIQMGMQACISAWKKSAGCDIAEVVFHVPRRSILKEWGFGDVCQQSEKVPTSDGIPVYFFFPLSLLEGMENCVTISDDMTENGVRRVELDNISRLPSSVPLTVFFHGGAFVIGDIYSGWVSLIRVLVENERRPVIVASVDYSLAPEHPFPNAVEEALTVVSYILEQCPDRKVHISGISAGGSLSAIAAMECFRKYPGRIASALIGTAYLDPKADSLSYYMNRDSAHLPTVSLLRWGWQAYLGMPPSKDKDESESTMPSTTQALGIQSNRTTWSECKWNQTPMNRLITPQVDLPAGLDSPEAPQFIMTTNRADPLLDECLDLLAKLKERSAKVTYLDHMGSHWIGTELDKLSLREVVDAWSNVLFRQAT